LNSYILLLLVGISVTIRTHKNNIKKYIILRKLSNNNLYNIITDNHNSEINLYFKQWISGLIDGDEYIFFK
jgi:hypothetical protein